IYRLAESYVRSQNFRSGVEAFLLVRNAFPKSEYATGAAYHLGNLALKQDQNGKRASQYYRIYLKASPGGKFAPEIGKQLLAMEAASENPLTLSASDHDLIAYAFYKHTLWSLALKQWSETGNKHILAAACLLKSGQKKEAILALISAAKANPQDPLINNVATEMCKSLSSAEALSLWKQVLAVKPEKIDEILWNIARRSGSAAPGYYQQIVSAYPNSTYAPESLWWLIWDHAIHGYKQKGAAAVAHFSKAAAYCAQGLKLHQNSEAAPRYAFWLGKFQEKLGKLALAKDIYRQTAKQYAGTYYGYRSAHRLKHLESLKKSSKVVPDRKWQIVLRPSPNPAWRWPEPPQFFNWQTLPAAIGPTASILASIGEYDECLELLPAVSPVNFKSWLLRHAGQ
ncbi:MAG: hypothetical protein K8F91_10835, partial [Candidatus Obscuribacterales bacterium]|nr:hypothetical protein [Candidatus Obscuribacterales bacterium]